MIIYKNKREVRIKDSLLIKNSIGGQVQKSSHMFASEALIQPTVQKETASSAFPSHFPKAAVT